MGKRKKDEPKKRMRRNKNKAKKKRRKRTRRVVRRRFCVVSENGSRSEVIVFYHELDRVSTESANVLKPYFVHEAKDRNAESIFTRTTSRRKPSV